MKNVGFGGLYKEKTAYILLDNGSSINVYNVETYESILDDSFTLTGSIDLSYLHAGEYTVYFVLADNWMGGAKRGIRFANYFMYNEELQANRLTTITVKGSVKKSM